MGTVYECDRQTDSFTTTKTAPCIASRGKKIEHVESYSVVSCGGVYSPVGSRDPVYNCAANSTRLILSSLFNFSTKSVLNYTVYQKLPKIIFVRTLSNFHRL